MIARAGNWRTSGADDADLDNALLAVKMAEKTRRAIQGASS